MRSGDRAKALHVLKVTCQQCADLMGGYQGAGYATALLRKTHKLPDGCEWEAASAKQLWQVMFTLRNRAAAKRAKARCAASEQAGAAMIRRRGAEAVKRLSRPRGGKKNQVGGWRIGLKSRKSGRAICLDRSLKARRMLIARHARSRLSGCVRWPRVRWCALAPEEYAWVPRDDCEPGKLVMCRWTLRGRDDKYRPVPMGGRFVRLCPAVAAELGFRHLDRRVRYETIMRLWRAEMIEMVQISPQCYLLDLESWFRPLGWSARMTRRCGSRAVRRGRSIATKMGWVDFLRPRAAYANATACRGGCNDEIKKEVSK